MARIPVESNTKHSLFDVQNYSFATAIESVVALVASFGKLAFEFFGIVFENITTTEDPIMKLSTQTAAGPRI